MRAQAGTVITAITTLIIMAITLRAITATTALAFMGTIGDQVFTAILITIGSVIDLVTKALDTVANSGADLAGTGVSPAAAVMDLPVEV